MTPTAFDKELDRLNLTYAQIDLIKQAVETHIIGDVKAVQLVALYGADPQ